MVGKRTATTVTGASNPPGAPLELPAFNPLHPRPLGHSVERALLQQPCHPLPPEQSFLGAGVYAIYYSGDSPYYRPIALANREGCHQPIYFGKAVPKGTRRGLFVEKPGTVLHGRLADHAGSIAQVEANTAPSDPAHLRLVDFKCRFLVVEPVWIPLIESLSIENFRPAWNGLLDGFGHHDQGVTRRDQKRSFWDTLHPGRPWAIAFMPNPLQPEMIGRVMQVWLGHPEVKLPSRPKKASAEMIAAIFEAWLPDPLRFRTARWLRAHGHEYTPSALDLAADADEEDAAHEVVVLDDDDDDD